MSMMRSLDSGVSGLSNHQSILDITANNLANISTSGFKGSRVSFNTAMNQTASAGSSPGGQSGGTNPKQIGLGVANGSVDVDMRQGALQSTGRSLDLAIQGEGFFKVTKVNPALKDAPELVNAQPYDGAWMIEIEPSDTGELGELLSADAYAELAQ